MAVSALPEQVLRTCGVRVDPVSLEQAVGALLAFTAQGSGRAVHLVNAYTLSLAHRDPGFAALVDRGDLNLPDGMPLVWLARRAGLHEVTGRVYGPDLLLATVDRGRPRGLRHLLYGAAPGVADRAADALRARFPGAHIAESVSPPFREATPADVDALASTIRATGADLVWVGLGTPRQDQFVARHHRRLGVPLVAVGAAFDFLSGEKRQAPRWVQERGLEWAFRLATEPRRLWRRYLIGNLVFLHGVSRGVTVERAPAR